MRRLAVATALLLAAPALAETDFRALSEGERLLLGAELRAVLRAHPEIVERALTPSLYEDDIASDLALIARHADRLFAGHDVALFVEDSCADCDRAAKELHDLARARGLSVNIVSRDAAPDIAEDLQIDTLPFYVLPEVMLRGAMPAHVLGRFLDKL